MSDNLEQELIAMILDLCSVDDIAAEEVDAQAPLIGPQSSMGLDSLDAVEVVVAVQKKYNVRIGGKDTSREVLQSVTCLADYVRQNRPS